jgi:hypothetical protein
MTRLVGDEGGDRFLEARPLRDHRAEHTNLLDIISFAKTAGVALTSLAARDMLYAATKDLPIDEKAFQALKLYDDIGGNLLAKNELDVKDSNDKFSDEEWEDYDESVWEEVESRESTTTTSIQRTTSVHRNSPPVKRPKNATAALSTNKSAGTSLTTKPRGKEDIRTFFSNVSIISSKIAARQCHKFPKCALSLTFTRLSLQSYASFYRSLHKYMYFPFIISVQY